MTLGTAEAHAIKDLWADTVIYRDTLREAQFTCTVNGGPVTYENLNPEVGTLDASLRVTRIRDGLLTLRVRNRWMTRLTSAAIYHFPEVVSYSNYMSGSLGEHWLTSISDRLAGITAENCPATCSASICPTCPAIQLFSTYNNSTLSYTWSTTGWAHDIDLTSGPVARGCTPGESGCSTLNQYVTGTFTGVMISPVHLLLGHPGPFPAGTQIVLVDKDNNVYVRTTGAGTSVAVAWLNMNILTEPVPASIDTAKVLPADWYTVYAPGYGTAANLYLPAIVTHQWHDAAVHATSGVFALGGEQVLGHGGPLHVAPGSLLFETIVGGDSGTAAFTVINGQTVILSLTNLGGGGAHVSDYIDQINTAMAALQGGANPYQLQIMDLSGFLCDWAGCPGQ
jgi:hypothetical protein